MFTKSYQHFYGITAVYCAFASYSLRATTYQQTGRTYIIRWCRTYKASSSGTRTGRKYWAYVVRCSRLMAFTHSIPYGARYRFARIFRTTVCSYGRNLLRVHSRRPPTSTATFSFNGKSSCYSHSGISWRPARSGSGRSRRLRWLRLHSRRPFVSGRKSLCYISGHRATSGNKYRSMLGSSPSDL